MYRYVCMYMGIHTYIQIHRKKAFRGQIVQSVALIYIHAGAHTHTYILVFE